jgi:hypothetical protein
MLASGSLSKSPGTKAIGTASSSARLRVVKLKSLRAPVFRQARPAELALDVCVQVT